MAKPIGIIKARQTASASPYRWLKRSRAARGLSDGSLRELTPVLYQECAPEFFQPVSLTKRKLWDQGLLIYYPIARQETYA